MLVYGRMLGLHRGQLVLRDRTSGTETVLADHEVGLGGVGSFWPQVSPNGTRVIYRAITNSPGHYLVSTGGGAAQFLSPIVNFGLATDWSPNGKRVIGECSSPAATNGICEVDVDTSQSRGILKDPQAGELLYPSFSCMAGGWRSCYAGLVAR